MYIVNIYPNMQNILSVILLTSYASVFQPFLQCDELLFLGNYL